MMHVLPKPHRHGCKAAAALAALGAVFTVAPAAAQGVTTNSTAEVVDPGTLVKDTDLDFGMIATAGSSGSVSLDVASGAATTTGDLAIVGSNLPNRALFKASAPIGIVMIYSGDPSVTLTRSGGTETMQAFLSYDAGAGLLDVVVFGLPIGVRATAPEQEIFVGGTLLVNPGQAEGYYEGEFTLTVAYL